MIITDKKMLQDIMYSDGDWLEIEEGEWTQDCKYQLQTNIVQNVVTGKFYRYTIARSGSPFTDWEYDHDYGDMPELQEVELKVETITREVWRPV